MSWAKCNIGTRATWAMAAGLTVLSAMGAVPVRAQEASVQEIRLRKLEADVRELQRQLPAGQSGTAGGGVPAATPVTDLLTRMDAVETQVARITAQNEEIANRQREIEARLGMTGATGVAAAKPAPAPAPLATSTSPPPAAPHSESEKSATASNLSAMTGGASEKPAHPAGSAHPSAERLAEVKAVIKPQTGDAGDDDYSYGFRLYTAKFYPEAEQQLKMYIDKYPRDTRISYARNLLGRAYLDDGKPRDAAPWFLQNYKADPNGPRAADSLLGLAEAMRQLGDNSRACIALGEFGTNYTAQAKGRLRQEYTTTKSGLACN